MTIGQRIRERRLALKMSVDALAKRLGKNKATIYRYEKGEIENLPIDMLIPIAEALGTTPAWLMGWPPTENLICAEFCINDIHTRYASKDPIRIERLRKWYDEFGDMDLTCEEHAKLIEYAKFLIYLREK